MTTKRRNIQSFEAQVNGNDYEFYCYTTSTRNGFCHTVQTYCDYRNIETDTKVSYCNRTWERFDYETALSKAIDKCPKADREALREIIIERKAKSEHEAAEAFVNSFATAFNGLNDQYKERVRNAVGVIETKEQADAAMAVTQLAGLFQMMEG